MKTDDFRPALFHKVAHRPVERRAAGTRHRCTGIEAELDVVTREPLAPGALAPGIDSRCGVAEEIEVDRMRGLLADQAEFCSNLIGVQKCTAE